MIELIHVKFFARLKEEIGTDYLGIPAYEAPTLDALKQALVRAHPDWAPLLNAPLLTAVNKTMVQSNQPLKPGDEVALFPPVTGG